MKLNATSYAGRTLLAVLSKDFPLARGNCFSLYVKRKPYKIVNFVLENLEELQRQGLKWPIKIAVLDGSLAVIHDSRIGDRWYRDGFCEICCPRQFLPITQEHRIQREEALGARKTCGSYPALVLVKPEYP